MDEREPTQGHKSPPGYVAAPGNVSPVQGQVPSATAQQDHWYFGVLPILVTLVLVFPLGLYLIWASPRIGKTGKTVSTVAFGLFLVFGMVAPRRQTKSPSANTPATSSGPKGTTPSANVPSSGNAQVGTKTEPNSPTPVAATSTMVSPGHNTKLAQLGRESFTSNQLEAIVQKNEWAYYPPGTTDCYDPDNPHVNLTEPPTEDEFEAKRLKSQRSQIASGAIGKLIRFEGNGKVGTDDATIGDFLVSRSKYDFGHKAWTLTISFDSTKDPYWPIGATDPVIQPTTLTSERDREIGKIGGKKVTVRGTVSDTLYENRSKLAVVVPMAPDLAEQHKESIQVEILVLEKFVGLGFHKVCQRDCSLGQCNMMNRGAGTYYRASTVGYEVYVEGAIVAQR